MFMPAAAKRRTAAEVLAMIDPTRHWPRYEVVDGALLVTPGPAWSHQNAATLLWQALHAYVRAERVGHAFVPLVEGRYPRDWSEAGRLLLVAEVLSRGSMRHDRVDKRHLYQHMGVPEYWIIDPEARLVERWRPGDSRGERLATAISWQPEGAKGPLVLDFAAYFTEVLGE